MPTYSCTCRPGFLDASKKAGIANAITAAHAEITGAPPYFAQVIFHDVSSGNQFIGGRKLEHNHIFVFGHIRSGRNIYERKLLIERLTRDVGKAANVKSFSVWVYLHELPPSAMVEFGHILPEAGNEAAWAASLPDDDAARMQKIGKRGS